MWLLFFQVGAVQTAARVSYMVRYCALPGARGASAQLKRTRAHNLLIDLTNAVTNTDARSAGPPLTMPRTIRLVEAAIRIQRIVNDVDCDSYLDALGSDVIIVHTLNTLGELPCPALLSQVTALAADITTFGCGRRWLGDGRPNL